MGGRVIAKGFIPGRAMHRVRKDQARTRQAQEKSGE